MCRDLIQSDFFSIHRLYRLVEDDLPKLSWLLRTYYWTACCVMILWLANVNAGHSFLQPEIPLNLQTIGASARGSQLPVGPCPTAENADVRQLQRSWEHRKIGPAEPDALFTVFACTMQFLVIPLLDFPVHLKIALCLVLFLKCREYCPKVLTLVCTPSWLRCMRSAQNVWHCILSG